MRTMIDCTYPPRGGGWSGRCRSGPTTDYTRKPRKCAGALWRLRWRLDVVRSLLAGSLTVQALARIHGLTPRGMRYRLRQLEVRELASHHEGLWSATPAGLLTLPIHDLTPTCQEAA